MVRHSILDQFSLFSAKRCLGRDDIPGAITFIENSVLNVPKDYLEHAASNSEFRLAALELKLSLVCVKMEVIARRDFWNNGRKGFGAKSFMENAKVLNQVICEIDAMIAENKGNIGRLIESKRKIVDSLAFGWTRAFQFATRNLFDPKWISLDLENVDGVESVFLVFLESFKYILCSDEHSDASVWMMLQSLDKLLALGEKDFANQLLSNFKEHFASSVTGDSPFQEKLKEKVLKIGFDAIGGSADQTQFNALFKDLRDFIRSSDLLTSDRKRLLCHIAMYEFWTASDDVNRSILLDIIQLLKSPSINESKSRSSVDWELFEARYRYLIVLLAIPDKTESVISDIQDLIQLLGIEKNISVGLLSMKSFSYLSHGGTLLSISKQPQLAILVLEMAVRSAGKTLFTSELKSNDEVRYRIFLTNSLIFDI
jgi:hypothetical protein